MVIFGALYLFGLPAPIYFRTLTRDGTDLIAERTNARRNEAGTN